MIGETILHYKIIEKLGEGGMGVVYLAEDTKLKRNVAIKFLPRHIVANAEERRRFEIEAQAAASLNHPNITTIYAIEEDENDVFIVMEYIDGVELNEKIKSGHLPSDESINIAIQIAEGLGAAHKKGIVHRDIKSSNIMITKDIKVKIMDFGLARIGDEQEITKSGVTIGTIAYMSPEQLKGEDVDYRTDIWSFGVVLYQMLTGQLPFKADYEQATIYNILNEKHLSANALQPTITESLNKIIDRCLEKEPSARFQQSSILINELKLSVREAKRKNSLEGNSKRSIIPIAVLPFKDISQEHDNKYFSDGLTEEIITKLSKLKKVKIISRTSVLNYDRSGKTMKQIATELDVRYIIEGSVRKDVSNLRITIQLIDALHDNYLWADNYNGTTHQIFDFQEDVAARIVKALKIKLTPQEKRNLKRRTTQDTEAYQYYLKGRYFWNKRTMEGFETAINYFEKAIELDGNYALAWSGIADTYHLITDLKEMSRMELYPKTIAAVSKALELDNHLSEAHTSLASLLMLKDWDWQNSLREFKLAIKLNPNYATAHHWYSQWLLYNGMFDEAIVEISTAAKLDPLSPAILVDKGMYFYYSRDYDRAIEFAMKSLELEPNLITPYRLRSLAYLGKGMYPEAIAENKKWTERKNNPAETTVALGYCYALAGRRQEALKIAESESLNKKLSGNILRGIALIYTALGEKDTAFSLLEKAFQNRSETLFLLKIDPKLDPIRADHRFNSLIERVGLKKEEKRS